MGPQNPPLSIEQLTAEVARVKQLTQSPLAVNRRASSDQLAGYAGLSDEPVYGDLEPRSDQLICYKSKDSYEGDTLGNMRHGHGIYTSPDGDTYKGEWRYNRRQGIGCAAFKRTTSAGITDQPLPVSYEGEWEDDNTQGHGICTYQDGATYTGDWRCNQRSGWGKHVFSNADWYEGEWAADAMHGQGLLKFVDGSYLKAEWSQGQPKSGHWCSADGRTEYEGQFKGMLWHGFGTMHQTGVKKYMGQWRNSLEHGHGQCVTADGLKYNGQWVQGTRQGEGKASRGDGYLYSGGWLNDLMHGHGKCRFADGSKFEGEWQAGKRHGQGVCLLANCDQYKGQWQADAQHGPGVCVYASGDKYSGEWKAGKRHGHGKCRFADGTKFTGEWEEDAWLQSAAEPSLCTAAGPGLSRAEAGQEAAFVIQAYDEQHNKRLSGGDCFLVHLLGPAGKAVAADVADLGDGTYTVTYCCTVAGGYDVHITSDAGERVGDSPYTVAVAASQPVARKSTVCGPGRMHALVAEPAEFVIEGRDRFGNRCDGKLNSMLPVSIELSCKPFSCEVEATALENGSYLCRYTASQPGFYRLEATSKGVHLCGSPFSVQISGASEHSHNNDKARNSSPAAAAGQIHVQQQPNMIKNICQPLVDRVKLWEEVAGVEYAADGDVQGWHTAAAAAETSEDKYMKTNPTVPVVQNLEDIWLVSKLQSERKATQHKQEQLAQLRNYKQMSGHSPSNK